MLTDEFSSALNFKLLLDRVRQRQKADRDQSEKMHAYFLSNSFDQLDDIPDMPPGLQIAWLNYLLDYVYENATQTSKLNTINTSFGPRSYVDEEAYPLEMDYVRKIKTCLLPPLQLFDAFFAIADDIAENIGTPELTTSITHFPYMGDMDKLYISDRIGQIMSDAASNGFEVKINPVYTYLGKDMPPGTFGRYLIGQDQDKNRFYWIEAARECLDSGNMVDFVFAMAHEHGHATIDSMARLYGENKDRFNGHPYEESFFFAWSVSHSKGFNRYFQSIYDMDVEELLCNGTAARVVRQIQRFLPTHQITHQPLLEI